MKISRILIANRGEIAVRIIRTCRALGIETVLACSEADRGSLGARLAAKSVVIGPPMVSTYLDIPTLIKTAKQTGADAIHPGYGFLSEKPEFSKACEENEIVFIGPKHEHIHKMGNKLIARELARAAGVPILPGTEKVQTADEVRNAVDQIGFPVMIKAAAGGGGRGMKIITEDDRDSLLRIYEQAAAEASAAFGDGSLYVERYIANARHIEVQLLGDKHGNVIHLGERDCSTQRRHQKLIEEAGAPNIPDQLRQKIRESAVLLAENISYESAGTVEFIYDQDKNEFFFLEMNTRIQVEHPVTEMITGVDLVAEQIKIAEGKALTLKQSEIRFTGHAIECRINAEKPEDGFRPSPGTITRWETPQGPGVRIDSHCVHGYKVPFFYDSLIGKLIVHGENRVHAIGRCLAALDEFCVEGIDTTIPFLMKVIKTPEFSEGRVSTRILEKVL